MSQDREHPYIPELKRQLAERKIDRLRPDDAIVLELPYGTFLYQVLSHKVVDSNDVSS